MSLPPPPPSQPQQQQQPSTMPQPPPSTASVGGPPPGPPPPSSYRQSQEQQQPQQPYRPQVPPVHPPHPATQQPPIYAPASQASSVQPVSQQAISGPHLLSLKVMRISTPSLAASTSSSLLTPHLDPLSDPASTQTSDGLLEAVYDGIHANLSEDLLSSAGTLSQSRGQQSHPNSLPQQSWPIQPFLTLPSSFGQIHLGEQFRAYLCVRNESSQVIREPSLRIEIQTGVEAADTPNSRTEIGYLILSSPTSRDEATGQDVWELGPGQAMQTTSTYDVKDLGGHVLVCTVGYKVQSPATPSMTASRDIVWQERSFRKFYKFAVEKSPISVRTKIHNQRSPTAIFHPNFQVRERIQLEVQVQNISGSSLVFDGLNLKSSPDWEWSSVDRPSLGHAKQNPPNSHSSKEEQRPKQSVGKADMWADSQQVLNDGDVRQYLFTLVPTTPFLAANDKTRKSLDLGRTQEGWKIIGDPIGSLDVSWRMSLGEAGRLQTSQLVRRRIQEESLPLVSVSHSDASAVAVGANDQRDGDLLASVLKQRTPDPKPHVQLRICDRQTLNQLAALEKEKPVRLGFEIKLIDDSLSQSNLAGTSRSSNQDAIHDRNNDDNNDDDDDDDDKPLSELAATSPSLRARMPTSLSSASIPTLNNNDANTSMGEDALTPTAASSSGPAEAVITWKLIRRFKLAVQHCTVLPPRIGPHHDPSTSNDIHTPVGSATPTRTNSNQGISDSTSTSRPSSSSGGVLSGANLLNKTTGRLQSNLSNLVRTASLSSTTSSGSTSASSSPFKKVGAKLGAGVGVSGLGRSSLDHAADESGASTPTLSDPEPPAVPPKSSAPVPAKQSSTVGHGDDKDLVARLRDVNLDRTNGAHRDSDQSAIIAAPQRPTLPPPYLPYSTIQQLYQLWCETHSQAIPKPLPPNNNPASAIQVPQEFLPTVDSSILQTLGISGIRNVTVVDCLGSTLIRLPDIEMHVERRHSSSENGAHRASISISPQTTDGSPNTNTSTSAKSHFDLRYLISSAQASGANDRGAKGSDTVNDVQVVRFGALRVLVLGWVDHVSVSTSPTNDEGPGEVEDDPTQQHQGRTYEHMLSEPQTLKVFPVVAEGVLFT